MSKNANIKATLDIQAQITDYKTSIKEFQDALNKLHLAPNIRDGINNIITDLKTGIADLEKQTANGEINLFNEDAINKTFKNIEDKYNSLIKKAQSQGVQTAGLEKNFKILQAMVNLANDYDSKLEKANNELQKRKDKLNDLTSNRDEKAAERDSKKIERDLARDAEIKAEKMAKAAQSELAKKLAARDAANKAVTDSKAAYTGKNWGATSEAKTLRAEAAKAQQEYVDQINNASQATDAYTAAQQNRVLAEKDADAAMEAAKLAQEEYDKNITKFTQDVKTQEKEVAKMGKGTSTVFKQLKQDLIDFGNANNIDWTEFGIDPNQIKNINDFKTALDKIKQSSSSAAQVVHDHMTKSLEDCGNAAKVVKAEIDRTTNSIHDMSKAEKDIEGLKKKLMSFFAIDNAARLFRRALRSAFETVKDLDAVMTEMAVVTKYQIKDLWDKLPEYTQRANELGVTIHDAYESMTIFLQQGLAENQALQISTETLKMARIAGLNASDATDRMTNALRGFNMELDGLSARRVDDVYNNLAAKSAANVDQISKAMTKVASLAHSANMEFENTAAFLTQIIETTRESAETAGTALKTVVARFSEVKKLYSTGELLGADEEGEEIDVNKISTALRTAGINLNEYFTGAKGLDQIFIELASKWENLDEVQKRYIATMAAGSRQQSRFLAMMSDYKRTQELVGYATNASGFANEQYAKTLESLKTKLSKLKNAWDVLVTTIGNSTVIKGIVDILTNLLNTLNNITEKIPGLTGELVKFGTVIAGFKLGKTVISKVFDGLKGVVTGAGQEAGKSFIQGLTSKIAGAIKDQQLKNSMSQTLGKTVDKVSLGKMAREKMLGSMKGSGAGLLGKLKGIPGVLSKIGSFLPMVAGLATQIALVGGAIAGIVAIHKHFMRLSPENQLKAAEASLERISKKTEQVEESYNELNNSISALTSKYTEIEDLTYGTNEWKNAVHEANKEVLSLIEKYPELARFVKLENSVLKISEEGTSTLLEKRQKELVSLQIAQTAASADVVQKRLDVAVDDSEYGQRSLSWGEKLLSGEMTEAEVRQKIAEAEGERERKRLKEQGFAGDELENAVSEHLNNFDFDEVLHEIKDLGDQSFTAQQQLKAFNDSLASASIQLANLTQEEAESITGYMTGNTAALFYDEAFKKADKFSKKEAREEYAKLSGYNDYDDYKKKVGEIDKDDAIKMLAGLYQAESAARAAKTAVDVVKDLPEGTLKHLLSGGEELSLRDLTLSKGKNDAVTAWNQLSESQQKELYDGDFATFSKNWSEIMTVAIEASEESRDFFANFEDSKITQIPYDIANGLKDNLKDVLLFSGEEEVKSIIEQINEVTAELDTNEAADFVKALNAIDWRNSKSVEEFSNQLKDLKIPVDTESEAFEQLTKDLIEGAKAVRKVNFESLTKQIESLASILSEVVTSGKRSFTSDQYEAIIKADPEMTKYFVRTVTGWEYVGQHMELLVTALDKNTDVVLNEATNQIGSKLEIAKVWDDLKEKTGFKEQSERGQMVDVIAEARRRGIDFSAIGWDKLADIDLSLGSNDEVLKKAFEEFSTSIFGQTDTLKKQKEETIQESIGLKAATRNPVENAVAWNTATGADKDTIQKAIIAQAQAAGVARAEIDKYNEAMKKASETEKADLTLKFSHITMSYQVAERWGLEKDALDELALSLMKTEGLEEEQIGLAYDMAASQLAASKGAKDIVDNFDNWDGVLWDSLDGLQKMKEGTGEYAEALNTLKEDLKLMLGTDVNFDDKLFSANLPEILDYVKKISTSESEEIATNLIDELNEKLRGTLDIEAELNVVQADGSVTNVWQEIQDWFRLNPLEAGLDDTEYQQKLAQMLTDTGLKVEQVNKLFDGLGYDVDIKWGKKLVAINTGWDGKNVVYEPVYKDVVESIEYKPKGKANNLDSSTISKMGENAKKGKKDKNEHWENPYDELYNLSEKINESLRTREALERRYNQLLKDRSSNMKDIREEYNHNIEALRQEADLQSQMAQGRLRQIANIGNEVYTDSEGNRATFSQLGVTKYASYDASTGHITIDWEGLEQLEKTNNVKKGEAAEAYISQLEEWVESYEEVRDALWDIEDKMEEFAQKVIDSYLSFEERVMDAVVHERQQQIDNYQTLSDAIKESNDKVIEAMRESIDMERQIRDNTKTEEDIADKEQRLAYLQRDTSGANQVEQMQLQKEIDDARQDYTDTLIDQAIETLSKQNEDAYEQRQEQIEMMQTQLNFAQAEGLLWGQVYELMAKGIDPNTGIVQTDSELVRLLKNKENWVGQSLGAQEVWMDNFNTDYKNALTGLTELEAKYGKDMNGDLKVEDSDTRRYLSDIRNLAQQVTTQQAHGGAQGTSGGSGSTTGNGTQATAPTGPNASDLAKKLAADDQTIKEVVSLMGRSIYANFGAYGYDQWSNGKNKYSQGATVNFNGFEIKIEADNEGNGLADEIAEAFERELKSNVQFMAWAKSH